MKGLLIILELIFLFPAMALTFFVFWIFNNKIGEAIVSFMLKYYLHWLFSVLTWASLYVILHEILL